MEYVKMPQCLSCGWFKFENVLGELEDGEPLNACDVFPKGIPEDIWEGRFIHDRPYPGDDGVTQVPVDPEVLAEIASLR